MSPRFSSSYSPLTCPLAASGRAPRPLSQPVQHLSHPSGILCDKLLEHRHRILPSVGHAFGQSLPRPQVCRSPCVMTRERALCRGSGAEHDVLVLACGLVAFGRSLVSGPHARALASLRQRKPHLRLFLAVTTQSRISNPFPQGKHLLITLKVWTLKDAKASPLMVRPSCD